MIQAHAHLAVRWSTFIYLKSHYLHRIELNNN